MKKLLKKNNYSSFFLMVFQTIKKKQKNAVELQAHEVELQAHGVEPEGHVIFIVLRLNSNFKVNVSRYPIVIGYFNPNSSV